MRAPKDGAVGVRHCGYGHELQLFQASSHGGLLYSYCSIQIRALMSLLQPVGFISVIAMPYPYSVDHGSPHGGWTSSTYV